MGIFPTQKATYRLRAKGCVFIGKTEVENERKHSEMLRRKKSEREKAKAIEKDIETNRQRHR